ALFATCAVTMVLAPNIVWLHHAALLIPGLFILLAESHSTVVVAATLIAMFCIQCVRCVEAHLALPAYAVFGFAQVLLLVACAAFVTMSLAPPGLLQGRDRSVE